MLFRKVAAVGHNPGAGRRPDAPARRAVVAFLDPGHRVEHLAVIGEVIGTTPRAARRRRLIEHDHIPAVFSQILDHCPPQLAPAPVTTTRVTRQSYQTHPTPPPPSSRLDRTSPSSPPTAPKHLARWLARPARAPTVASLAGTRQHGGFTRGHAPTRWLRSPPRKHGGFTRGGLAPPARARWLHSRPHDERGVLECEECVPDKRLPGAHSSHSSGWMAIGRTWAGSWRHAPHTRVSPTPASGRG